MCDNINTNMIETRPFNPQSGNTIGDQLESKGVLLETDSSFDSKENYRKSIAILEASLEKPEVALPVSRSSSISKAGWTEKDHELFEINRQIIAIEKSGELTPEQQKRRGELLVEKTTLGNEDSKPKLRKQRGGRGRRPSAKEQTELSKLIKEAREVNAVIEETASIAEKAITGKEGALQSNLKEHAEIIVEMEALRTMRDTLKEQLISGEKSGMSPDSLFAIKTGVEEITQHLKNSAIKVGNIFYQQIPTEEVGSTAPKEHAEDWNTAVTKAVTAAEYAMTTQGKNLETLLLENEQIVTDMEELRSIKIELQKIKAEGERVGIDKQSLNSLNKEIVEVVRHLKNAGVKIGNNFFEHNVSPAIRGVQDFLKTRSEKNDTTETVNVSKDSWVSVYNSQKNAILEPAINTPSELTQSALKEVDTTNARNPFENELSANNFKNMQEEMDELSQEPSKTPREETVASSIQNITLDTAYKKARTRMIKDKISKTQEVANTMVVENDPSIKKSYEEALKGIDNAEKEVEKRATEIGGQSLLEKMRSIGRTYQQWPLTKKLLVSGTLIVAASGAAWVGGATGVAVSSAAFLGSLGQRVLGGLATFVATEGLLKRSVDKKSFYRTDTQRKSHTIQALIVGIFCGSGILSHALGNFYPEFMTTDISSGPALPPKTGLFHGSSSGTLEATEVTEELIPSNITLQNDINKLFGTKSFLGIGDVAGINSPDWSDSLMGFSNKTVWQVLESYPDGGSDSVGISNLDATKKMKDYLINLLNTAEVEINDDEKVGDYIKRALATISQPKLSK